MVGKPQAAERPVDDLALSQPGEVAGPCLATTREARLAAGRAEPWALESSARLRNGPTLRKVAGIGSTHRFSLQNNTLQVGLSPNFPRSVPQHPDDFPLTRRGASARQGRTVCLSDVKGSTSQANESRRSEPNI